MPAIIDRVVAQQVGDELYCHMQLLGKSDKLNNSLNRTCQNERDPELKKYQNFMRMAARKLRFNYSFMANQTKLSHQILITLAVYLILVATFPTIDCLASSLEQHQAAYLQNHHHHHTNPQHQLPVSAAVQIAQARAGGLEPGDYVDEAGELDVLVNQQQIPTAQLMAAAGHVVPENFFLPGGSIPALYAHRYQQQQQQQQQQQHNQQQHHQQQQQHHQQQQQQQHHHHTLEQMQQAASNVQARHVAPNKFIRQADLIAAATVAAEQADQSPLIDFNGYNMVAGASQQEARENPTDLADYINSPSGQTAALYEQQQHQHYAEQQVAAELAALMAANNQQNLQHQFHQQHQQQQQHNLDGGLHPSASNENMLSESVDNYAASIGPAYQISGNLQSQDQYSGQYDNNNNREQQKPYGLPTKSSSRKPSGMLEPLGNPKTISSPIIDLVANQMPKTSNLEKLAEKLPPVQTPTVFSFASSKDPSEKVKQVNQKKRTVMRQAEHLARAMIKSINDKFGTTIGDQSDIPFLLSALGPLGMAQNILFDPTLLVTLLNSAEKTYFSDVLPSPAKSAIRPVLNIFRVPNKKRDKANLLNIISFIASGGQVPASTPPKHRQGTGVEKMSKNKNRR